MSSNALIANSFVNEGSIQNMLPSSQLRDQALAIHCKLANSY